MIRLTTEADARGSRQAGVMASDTRRARGIRSLLAVALVAVLTACTPSAEPSPSPTVAEIPGTAVGQQAQWVLDGINAEEVPAAEDVEARFAPVMFEQLTTEDFQSVFSDLSGMRPWTPTRYEGSESQARVRIAAEGTELDMSVSVAEDGLIDGLTFTEPQPDRTPAASWDELRDEFADAAYEGSLTVHEAGVDEPTIEIGEPVSGPIGSIFKLYVLGAVVDAVAGGALTWETSLTIDGEVRSLPSGEMQDLPDGTQVTVLEAAEQMITISDNTATDLLIRAVGRDAVEATLADMGHADPAANTPFPATRELFWLGWGDAALREQWADAAGDPVARAEVLAAVPDGVPGLESGDWTVPAWQSGVDWFAAPADLARAHVALQERAATDAGAPVRDILGANPGIGDQEAWDYVGFKGGSSVGVLAGSWYLEREGAAPVVLTVMLRSDDAAAFADPGLVFAMAEDAAALLAAE